ncbi:DUF4143 domain-containing protein [Desulfohalobiaceae bacterium Ax17]|nr:DUF4143 domain-containing protein [Desulfovulcanus ferrireducens]MBT8762963.1 DUF4143 domain-containing protein [Desulfovulcanus ferrireducens]
MSELGTRIGLAQQTVERYLDLLEKCFVIKKVTGFARNLRKEVSKTARYYFLDNGILNAVINNFNPLSLRNDVGELWENFIFVERLKRQSYLQTHIPGIISGVLMTGRKSIWRRKLTASWLVMKLNEFPDEKKLRSSG